ncbi:UMP kinase [bacterium]|nr:UMP kinase [bacterium]|tara:strand:- start:609 stop:1304 length:696 start_codon:yes stop_codon:yes gene_type:complete
MSTNETVVMSVGGSLIVPDQIDTDFLIRLKELVTKETAGGRRFIIIAGGGKTARRYQDAAKQVVGLDPEDLDWMGIHSTRLNGHLLRTIFRDTAHPVMITNPDDILDISDNTKLIIGAGYRPGASSDLRAVQVAQRRKATKLINLSNIDYVYTADPKADSEAEKLTNITWTEFRKLIPSEWDPGLSSPFDPVAAKLAEEQGIEVANINGARIEELKKYLNGEEFIGTRIHN